MEPGYRFRLYLLTALVLVGFGTLLSRLYDFQIQRRDEFMRRVPKNRNVAVREPGTRGEIIDRNGIVLARNLRKYEVAFNLEEIRESYLVQHEEPLIDRVAPENGMPRRRTEKDIVTIVKEGPIQTLKGLGLARDFYANGLGVHYKTHGGLIPFPYRADLSYDDFSKFAEHNLDLPGVYLSLRPQREYPYGALACHVLGYLKQWEKGDVPDSATREFNHYVGDDKGIAGVEATMDEMLRGLEGRKTIVKDEKGRTIRMSDYTKPGTGAKLRLSLDAPVQYLLENTLRMAGRAAGVVMDVNTGEVLAMASVPDYNPNDFIPSITRADDQAYRQNKLSPLMNRAIAQFDPGSTMKIPISIAAALAGKATNRYTCNGYVSYGNAQVKCWIFRQHQGTHGNQNISEAIQHSCNPYFNILANVIGKDALVEGCSMVNIGKRTGIELPSESAGMLTGSRAWRAAYPNRPLTGHEIAMLSIGQGSSLATPLQVCAVAACVANGGKYYQPRLVKDVVSEDGKVLVEDKPKLVVDLIKEGIKPSDMELIRNGMRLSTNSQGGTSGKVKLPDPNIVAASKSGTAQSMDNGKPSNTSWIMSFAPYDKPKYAVCIMVQNGGSGGGVCGPLVNLVYRGLFARDLKGVKLPLEPLGKVAGNTDRIEKTIEISPEIIEAVESGKTFTPNQVAPTPVPQDPLPVVPAGPVFPPLVEDVGEEIGELPAGADSTLEPTQPPSDAEIPTPTITPEVDAEGQVIPKAVPVKDP